jgi:putative zinc finger/helix-turn-helix YgiT family protein
MITFKGISKIKKECPVCENERELVYGEAKEVLKVRGEEIEVITKVHYCPDGNHYFYTAEDEEAKFQSAYYEYRKRKGLLQPEEIRQIREQYGLTQRNFALLLGWGEITIHRYESGAIQDDVHNDILSIIKDFDNFKKYFYTKKNFIEPEIARKVEEKIVEIEKARNSQTFDLLVRLSSTRKKEIILPVTDTITKDYSAHNEFSQYSANQELALAA